MTTLSLILGAHKTGTSTAVAICNSDPNSHVLYEVDFAKSADANRNAELVGVLPNIASLFPSGHAVRKPLTEILRRNPALAERFTATFGVKLPGLSVERLTANADMPIVFVVRDVRTWICKNTVVRQNLDADPARDVVPLAVAYGDFLLASYRHENLLRLRMQDMMLDGGNHWPNLIAPFLGIETARVTNWWEKRAAIRADASYSNWATLHHSSFIQPRIEDTTGVLKDHAFWRAYTPIFDKYFSAPSGRFSAAEIDGDRRALADVGAGFTMTLEEGFASFESFKALRITQSAEGTVLDAGDRVSLEALQRKAKAASARDDGASS